MGKKNSGRDNFIFVASKLPWWLSLPLAVAAGWYFHTIATAPAPNAVDIQHLDSALTGMIFKAFATAGQFLVPLILIGGSIVSILGRRKRRALFESVNTCIGYSLAGISWQEFELLIGEVLRRQGYSVQETGGQGPDGGVDLIVRRDNERYLVQCKHWRATQVGVPVVRELYGAMAAEGAVGGFVVTSGTFSQPAREFAKGRNLHLIDGATLKEWLDTPKKPPMPQPAMTINARVEPLVETKRKQNPPPAPTLTPQPQPDPQPAPEPHAPACPHCREPMQIRVARTGRNAGGQFWGCASYPKCRGIRPIFATGPASNR